MSSGPSADRGQPASSRSPRAKVQPRERLVEEQQPRLGLEQPGQEHLLALALGDHAERTSASPADPGELHELERCGAVRVGVGVPPRLERAVLAGHHDVERVERRGEAPHHRAAHEPDAGPHRTPVRRTQPFPEDFDRPRRGVQPRARDREQGRLPRSVRARSPPHRSPAATVQSTPARSVRPSRPDRNALQSQHRVADAAEAWHAPATVLGTLRPLGAARSCREREAGYVSRSWPASGPIRSRRPRTSRRCATLARDVAERELAPERAALGRDRGVPAGVVGRDPQGRPVRHHDRRALRRHGHGRHRGRDRARGARPRRRVERDPRPAHLQRSAARDRAPRHRRDEGALAADGGDRARRSSASASARPRPARPSTTCAPGSRPTATATASTPTRTTSPAGTRPRACLVWCRFPGSEGTKGIGAVVVDLEADGVTRRGHPREDGPARHERGRARLRRRAHRARATCCSPATRRTATSFKTLIAHINHERCGNAAMCIGAAQGALEYAVALHERAHRSAASRSPTSRACSGRSPTWRRSSRPRGCCSSARVHLAGPHGTPPALETAMAKTAANLAAKFVCDEAIQLLGGYGYSPRVPGRARVPRHPRALHRRGHRRDPAQLHRHATCCGARSTSAGGRRLA